MSYLAAMCPPSSGIAGVHEPMVAALAIGESVSALLGQDEAAA